VAGRDISGLVSLFDIQKLPARTALFAIVTQLEIVMTNAIRREFGRDESWLEWLAPERRLLIAAEVDEIDGATITAQKGLRALMEDELASDVSWVYTANDLKNIILPLQSRVILIDCSYSTRAKRQAHLAGIARRCRQILTAEGVRDFSDADLLHVVELHYPDMRQTINALQRKYVTHHAA
jgi:hypothetical protein